MEYKLPDLSYDFNALEPVISSEIMTLHYTKHHQGYVNQLNVSLEKYAQAEKNDDLAAMIALQQAIRFNGGGHTNHSIFWATLAPIRQGGGELPTGPLLQAIQRDFGSTEKLIEKLSLLAVGVQGSGWAWLGLNKVENKLHLAVCANQDPLSLTGLVPLFGIDVWEHAYYLQYKNMRADYVKNIWNIVAWKNVEKRYTEA